jgi:hypothetical protein
MRGEADKGIEDPDRPLILDQLHDQLAQFRLFSDSDEEATDRVLSELGASGQVEHEMVQELATTRALARPERVLEAHQLAMHALEVLSRNGSRPPSQLRLGLLTGVARFLVQQVIRYIVRNHQKRAVDAIRDLYARRIAWMSPDDPARMVLIRARVDVERAAPSLRKNPGGLPTFLVGGAAVSSIAQVVRRAADAAAGSRVGFLTAMAVTFVLLAVASWVILRGAAVARRRIRVSLDHPVGALWETIGWCGRPPKDEARTFALVAIALTVAGWLILPLAAFLLFAIF